MMNNIAKALLIRVAKLDFFRSKFAKCGPFQSRLDQKKLFGPVIIYVFYVVIIYVFYVAIS